LRDFANILFAGPCNRACPFCIGRQVPDAVNVDNLDVFPPRGIERFIEAVNREEIREVVFTGTTTDPQLYRHEARLLDLLRARLHPAARFSVHTNGVRALARVAVFNRYDRACISFPSFDPSTYEKMMGSRRVPDLQAILRAAAIPVKVSCVVNEHNAGEMDAFLAECSRIGVRRLVVRRLYGETRRWDILRGLEQVGQFRGNPVLRYRGMEVTYWDFDESRCRSLNLFADGTLGTSYLLTETPELPRGPSLPSASPPRPAAGP
jgi:MoaA/NifB/PqqE/SkfB family radical SAM enzyme